ncbi:MAG: DUF481 domain-containing protein [Aeromonadaceae bacterium]
MRNTGYICSYLLLLPLSTLARADTLVMANGDRYSGKVTEQADKLLITLDYGGYLTLPRSAVSQWLRGKSTVAQSSAPAVSPSAAVTPQGPLSEVASTWRLGGSGDLDLRLKRNSTQTNNIFFKGALELEKVQWRHTLAAEYTYETSDDVTKTHKYKLEPAIDYFFSPKAFWRTTVSYDYNLISPIYLQMDYLTGPGYRFWHDAKGKERLELIAQSGVSNISWNDDAPALVLFYEGHKADYPVARLQWDYRQPLLQDKLELFSEGTYQKYLNQASSYIYINQSIDGSVGLRYYLTDYLRLGLFQELEWDDAWLRVSSTKYPLNEKEWRQKISLGAKF